MNFFFFSDLIELKSQIDAYWDLCCALTLNADSNNWFDSKDLRNVFVSASFSGFCVFGCYWSLQLFFLDFSVETLIIDDFVRKKNKTLFFFPRYYLL